MLSIFPVLYHELKQAARRASTYYSRVLAVCLATTIALALLFAGFGGFVSPQQAGIGLFIALSAVAYSYALLDGLLLTADCLSMEKRQGTLGLLFLTGLRGFEIVAGKFIPRFLRTTYSIAAAIPALGIALFLGGVTGVDFLKMSGALVNGACYAASLGILISTFTARPAIVLAWAVPVLTLGGFALPALAWWGALSPQWAGGSSLILHATPAGPWLHAIGSPSAPPFQSALLVNLGLAFSALALSSLGLPRVWQEDPSSKTMARFRGWFRGQNQRLDASLKLLPVYRGTILPGLVLAVCALTICLMVGKPKLWFETPGFFGFVVVTLALHFLLTIGGTVYASRGLFEDKQSGLLETLLTTPLGERVIVRGRMLLLKRRLFVPVLLVLVANVALFWLLTRLCDMAETLAWLALYLFLAAHLLAELYAISWIGLDEALRARSVAGALRRTILKVFCAHWFLLMVALAGLALASGGRLLQFEGGPALALIIYLSMFVLCLSYFCVQSILKVREDLRMIISCQTA